MSQYNINYTEFKGGSGAIQYSEDEKKKYEKLFDDIYEILDSCQVYRKTNIPNPLLEAIFYFEGYMKNPLHDSYLHDGSSPNRFTRFVVEMFLKEAGYTKQGPLWTKTVF